jgi:hypothetical protein
MSKSSFLSLTAVMLLLAGGSWWCSARVLKRWRQLKLEVSTLQSDMRSLRSDVRMLRSDASFAQTLRKTDAEMGQINDAMIKRMEERLSARMNILQAGSDSLSGTTTTLDPSGNGFGSLNTDTGRFLIACDNVQPYLSFQRRFTWPVGHFAAAASIRPYDPSRTFETPDQTDEDQANNYLRPTRLRKKQMD